MNPVLPSITQSLPVGVLAFFFGFVMFLFGFFSRKALLDFTKMPTNSRYWNNSLTSLAKTINEHFNVEELRQLCRELEIDYEDIQGEGKSRKATELVFYLNRRERIDDLISVCKRERPNVNWYGSERPSSSSREIIMMLPILFSIGGAGMMLMGGSIIINKVQMIDQQIPQVSLISISYDSDDVSHLIDLRWVDSMGINVREGKPLSFFDIWLDIQGNTPEEYSVQIKVFDNPQLEGSPIGETPLEDYLDNGKIQLDDIDVNRFEDGDKGNTWNVQESWLNNYLYLTLETYFQDRLVNRSVTPVQLVEKDGFSWLYDQPSPSFAAIMYSINDGSVQILDVIGATSSGLRVSEGDILTIHEVWYHYPDGIIEEIGFSAYLDSESDGFGQGEECYSQPVNLSEGVNVFNFSDININVDCVDRNAFRWEIPDNNQKLIMSLSPIGDFYHSVAANQRLVIDLNEASGVNGLISRDKSVSWPYEQVHYLDFESEADLENGTISEAMGMNTSSTQAFSGDQSLAITIFDSMDEDSLINWSQPLKTELIVGNIYWPEQEGIKISSGQICLQNMPVCSWIPIVSESWVPFVIDLKSQVNGDEIPYSELLTNGLSIRAKLDKNSKIREDHPYTFYVDGIQIFPSEQ